MSNFQAWLAHGRAIKHRGAEFIHMLDQLGQSRELSLAKTKIEEAVMWAEKHTDAKALEASKTEAEREADAREG